MNDIITSWIRTVVPAAVGTVVAWLGTQFEVVLDEQTRTGLVMGTAGLITAVYYGVVRVIETKVPSVGILLGSRKQPSYTKQVEEEER